MSTVVLDIRRRAGDRKQRIDHRLDMTAVLQSRRASPFLDARSAYFFVVRHPVRRRRGVARQDPPKKLDAKRLGAMKGDGGGRLGGQRPVTMHGAELSGER